MDLILHGLQLRRNKLTSEGGTNQLLSPKLLKM